MNKNLTTALIGIDWGITHLRAYCMGQDGEVLHERDSALGISAVIDKDFAGVLSLLVADWLMDAPRVPILMCGMIGSRHGWSEAPYSPCPANLYEVAGRSASIDVAGHPASIVGGMSTVDEIGRHDVMRGEETQIIGVAVQAGRQLIVAPGTHSKWVTLRNGTVESFRTYMTGEMFAILGRHSSLGWSTKAAEGEAHHEDTFAEGVQHALADPDLLHSLFSVRTRALFKSPPSTAYASYLSGVLIGNEVASGVRLHRDENVTLIASPKLARLYQAAFSIARIDKVECIDGDVAVTRGLWRIHELRASGSTA